MVRFDGSVAIVTGAGRGLGRAYALALAERGALVVVNDLGGDLSGHGADAQPARDVTEEIVAAGGDAVASTDTVGTESGAAAIVDVALQAWGRVDIVVNNAGNLEPGAVPQVRGADVQRHLDSHVIGAYEVTRAAWPQLVRSGHGRVVLTTSVGMFGGEHLLSYATAKAAVVALGRSLAGAGAADGIRVNMLAPAAETRMVTDPGFRARSGLPPLPADYAPDPTRGPERVVPMLLALAHPDCPTTGETYIAGLGRFARIVWGETPGVIEPDLDVDGLLARWDEVLALDDVTVHASSADAVRHREALLDDAARRSA